MTWQHFAHGADIGVRGIGATPSEAFAEAALALTAVVTDPATVVARTTVAITCNAPDLEMLFTDWLNAVVYEMATRRMLFRRFDVSIELTTLDATLHGEIIDVARHHPAVEVKGATYTALSISHDSQGRWIAQCIVDV